MRSKVHSTRGKVMSGAGSLARAYKVMDLGGETKNIKINKQIINKQMNE